MNPDKDRLRHIPDRGVVSVKDLQMLPIRGRMNKYREKVSEEHYYYLGIHLGLVRTTHHISSTSVETEAEGSTVEGEDLDWLLAQHGYQLVH